MNYQDTNQKPGSSGGYGKRPLWHWIVGYVVVGAVIYGLIYWLFFSGIY